jgi:hypothetical protein
MREGELLRVELAAKDGNRLWNEPGKLRQFFIELPALVRPGQTVPT